MLNTVANVWDFTDSRVPHSQLSTCYHHSRYHACIEIHQISRKPNGDGAVDASVRQVVDVHRD